MKFNGPYIIPSIVLLSIVGDIQAGTFNYGNDFSAFTVDDYSSRGRKLSRKLSKSSKSSVCSDAGDTAFYGCLDGDCMSGETGVRKSDDSVTLVKDLLIDDVLMGKNDTAHGANDCQTVFIGEVIEPMDFYANYTADHYIYDSDTGSIRTNQRMYDNIFHETVGQVTRESSGYDVMTSCPVAEDESGKFFTPFSSEICNGLDLSWGDYVAIYRALFDVIVVLGVTDYSFLSSFDAAYANLGNVCGAILKCKGLAPGSSADCSDLEAWSVQFVQEATTQDFQDKINQKIIENGAPALGQGAVTLAIGRA